jgi:hypothetical protein
MFSNFADVAGLKPFALFPRAVVKKTLIFKA